MNKIAVFYHIHKVNNWDNIFLQQIHRLCASGLYAASDLVHIGINGSDVNLPMMLPKFRLHLNEHRTDEIDTLISLHQFCLENKDHKVLYFHTKGVSNHNDNSFVLNWRLYMEYFNIDRWKECVDILRIHDCAGVESLFGYPDTRQSNHKIYDGHYAGNFWWARADYICQLDPSYLIDRPRGTPGIRELAELWIGTKDPNYYNFYTSKYEGRYLYSNMLVPSDYMIEMTGE